AQVSVPCDLTHFFTHDLPEFSVEQVGTHRDAFSGSRCKQAQHLGRVTGAVDRIIPGEVTCFTRHDIHQDLAPSVASCATVDPCVHKSRSIGNLRLNDLIPGGFFICRHINSETVVEEPEFNPHFRFGYTHGLQVRVRYCGS